MATPDPQSAIPPANVGHADTEARLKRLEEHAGFAEFSTDQLSSEIREINRRFLEFHRRVEAIERRLDALAAPPLPEGEDPID